MSEVNLAVLAESGKNRNEAKALTPLQEINDALKACTFGWFHLRLLCSSFVGFISGICITNTAPYILPNAECALNMNLLQKGILNAMPYVGKDHIEAKAPTPMQEINDALKVCTFGWFHLRLLYSAFVGLICGIFVTNTTPYILPNAECDLNMNLLQKGILNAMPFVGMLSSTVVSGFLTDTFGRKIFILSGYGGIALVTLIASMSQTYEMLITAKFFEGLLFAMAFSATVTFTSEYCHNGIRDRVMLLQSSFQSMGQIILAAASWGILTQDWRYTFFDGYIVLNTWNFYLLIMALWSVTAFILYCFLPESPKFLLTQHKYDEARETLIRIYKLNTGKPVETFIYKDLWKDKIKPVLESPEKEVKTSLAHQVVTGLHNVKPIFKKPMFPNLVLLCTMNFLVMVLYNVIRLWFPQLSTIVEHYSNATDSDQDLCVMLDAYTHDQRIKGDNLTVSEICIPIKSGAETYINSMILGSICIIPYMITGVLVNKVGKKYLEMTAGLISIGCTLGLRWASSKVQVVALFATDMAIGQTMMSLLQATTIEVFPTTTRTLALSMMMMSGRTGTLVGNVAFPILLDIGCVVPFFTLAGIMICVTMLSVLLPNKKKSINIKNKNCR